MRTARRMTKRARPSPPSIFALKKEDRVRLDGAWRLGKLLANKTVIEPIITAKELTGGSYQIRYGKKKKVRIGRKEFIV